MRGCYKYLHHTIVHQKINLILHSEYNRWIRDTAVVQNRRSAYSHQYDRCKCGKKSPQVIIKIPKKNNINYVCLLLNYYTKMHLYIPNLIYFGHANAQLSFEPWIGVIKHGRRTHCYAVLVSQIISIRGQKHRGETLISSHN